MAGSRPRRWPRGWLTSSWTAIVTSPLDRCRQTAEAIAAGHRGEPLPVKEDEQFAEVNYGDWTGQPLKRLAKDPLWRVVQAHPSAVRFPGQDGESLPEVQHRAVNAVTGMERAAGPGRGLPDLLAR